MLHFCVKWENRQTYDQQDLQNGLFKLKFRFDDTKSKG